MTDDMNGIAPEDRQDGITGIIESGQAPMYAHYQKLMVAKLLRMKKEANKAKEAHSKNWAYNLDFYRGKNHWPPNMDASKVSGQMNFTQQLVERKAALLTDSKPVIIVNSMLSDKASDAIRMQGELTGKALTSVFDGIWAEHGLGMRLARAIIYAQCMGGVAFNTTIDMERGYYGMDPTFFVLDPRTVAFDPFIFCGDDLYRAQYQMVSDLMPTDYLRYRFRNAGGEKIQPSSQFKSGGEDGPGFISAMVKKLFGWGSENESAIDRTYVDEFWVRDYTMDAGKERLLYPKGRHIILVDEKDILVDEENPYIDGQWPIDYLEWHIDLGSLWGFGDVELYESPQQLLNKLMSLLVENAQLMTNSIWKGDADALDAEDWDKLTNEPGAHVKVRPGRKLDRVPPPPLNAGLFNLINVLMGGMEKISGITAAMEGRRAGQVTSGAAIDSLQMAAQTVIRFKARQMEALLQRVGQKMISRIFQYMTDDRVFQITGDAEQMKAFHWDAKKYVKQPELTHQDFRFSVVPGSSLATNNFQKTMFAVQLHQMGIIRSRKRVLDIAKMEDREAIEKENLEIEQREQAAMIEMAQAGVQQPGGKGGPNARGSAGAGGRRNDQVPTQMNQGAQRVGEIPI